MVTRDFSGYEVAKALVNKGNFQWVRTPGDHAVLKWEHPDGPEVKKRSVTIPLHDHVRVGTLRGIAEDAGAKDFEKFCEWIPESVTAASERIANGDDRHTSSDNSLGSLSQNSLT